MNLFFLSWSVRECAQFHCDKHVVKMILEAAQMLFTAHHLLQADALWQQDVKAFRIAHRNHPMTVWVRANTANYRFLAGLGLELCREYTRRYEKTHATEGQLRWLMENMPPLLPTAERCSPPPLCMPDFCKVRPDDPIFCYRLLYIVVKRPIVTFKKGVQAPDWFTNKVEWNMLTAEQQELIDAAMKEFVVGKAKKRPKRVSTGATPPQNKRDEEGVIAEEIKVVSVTRRTHRRRTGENDDYGGGVEEELHLKTVTKRTSRKRDQECVEQALQVERVESRLRQSKKDREMVVVEETEEAKTITTRAQQRKRRGERPEEDAGNEQEAIEKVTKRANRGSLGDLYDPVRRDGADLAMEQEGVRITRAQRKRRSRIEDT